MGVVENSMQGASGNQTREPHSVALRLGEFGGRALEAAARGHDLPVETVIADACRHFAVEIQRGRLATRLPRLRDDAGDCEPSELELHLPARIWRALEQEAEKQGAALSRIVEHALLLYLADLDSGRAVCRILEPEQGD